MFVSSAIRLASKMRAGRAAHLTFLICLGGFFPPHVAAADTVAAWLERMVQAAHQLNYTGTFVYQQGGSLQTMRIIHSADDAGEHERLVSLSGDPREVIREHDKVTCLLPEDSSMVVDHAGPSRSFPIIQPSHIEPLRQYYDFKELGSDRIAGLKARHIAIIPRDQYRYGQNMWLGEDSGLLLRAEVLDEQGQIVEQVMFTSLELHEKIPPEMLAPQTKNPGQIVELGHESESVALAEGQTRWQVAALPPGFHQDIERLHYLPHKSQPVEHHLYSDGLASVSVFIEKVEDGDSGFIGTSRMGGVNAYGRRMDGYLATVVGEVPPATVKQIAESIQTIAEQ
jgi:sigma-E factor negative regulatory protein RseB